MNLLRRRDRVSSLIVFVRHGDDEREGLTKAVGLPHPKVGWP